MTESHLDSVWRLSECHAAPRFLPCGVSVEMFFFFAWAGGKRQTLHGQFFVKKGVRYGILWGWLYFNVPNAEK